MIGAYSLSRHQRGRPLFFTVYPKDDRSRLPQAPPSGGRASSAGRSLGRPLVAPSTNRSDASRFVSHVLRPSPEGTDIPRLTVFDLEPCSLTVFAK
jgi:hypothetical protein